MKVRRDIDEAELRRLVEEGVPQRVIAMRLGVGRTTIQDRMKELGLKVKRSEDTNLPAIPSKVGNEDRRKLEYILGELARGNRSKGDKELLRERYLEILHSPNPDPPRLYPGGLRASGDAV
jgi:hypothetical protein